jgi:glycosyltransferase involved in cell wall biosynthesis
VSRLSVFIPVFNCARFLPQAIESLVGQTFRDFELVVVDDGSTDDTALVAAAWAVRDSRIRLVRHATNLGLSAARNTGWRAAEPGAPYVMNHDGDDLSDPQKLEHLVSVLDRTPSWSAAGCFCRYVDEDGRTLGFPALEWHPSLIRLSFADLNSMAISATLIRRSVFEDVGPFRSDYGGCDDYDFWARALARGHRLANVPAVLHAIRLHAGSMGATETDQMQAHARRVSADYRSAVRVPRVVSRAVVKSLRGRMLLRQPRLLRLPLTVSRTRRAGGAGGPTRPQGGGPA